MSDFSQGMLVGLAVWPMMAVCVAASVYVLGRLNEAEKRAEEPPTHFYPESGDPPLDPIPLKNPKSRTMWDREDPFVPKDPK